MKILGLLNILLLTVLLLGCGLMPPKRQYVRETKRQVIPGELLNTHWVLQTWDNRVPDCKLTINFCEEGKFTFKWNDLDFAGDNLWYLVKDSFITFQTRPIEKIVWTAETHELAPDNFAMGLSGITNYKVDNDMLILSSTDRTYVFKRT